MTKEQMFNLVAETYGYEQADEITDKFGYSIDGFNKYAKEVYGYSTFEEYIREENI